MHEDTPLLDPNVPSLPESAAAAPFVIEHTQEEHTGSRFRPSARLILTERIRTSGLWRALTPEEFANTVLLLSFVTPNGWCRPTLPELADAMGVSHAKARTRLERLLRIQWQGQPLASLLPRPDGLDAYLPGRQLVTHEQLSLPEPLPPPPVRTASREAVIAYSRSRYAKTRGEVERQIGEMMGWEKKGLTPPDFAGDDPAVASGKQQAFQAMTGLGMSRDQALDLLSRFDLGNVERQIAWLPQRNAKNPARFLAAAIEGGYDRPLTLRALNLRAVPLQRQLGPVQQAETDQQAETAQREVGATGEAEFQKDATADDTPDDTPTQDIPTPNSADL